ncbi:flagellar filament capping protein FliD [Azospirillum halopraeferens]|uniref:flagellar filament capping protein FliD n=1 Tax=Azospirillum halopraeferens TaxID=34010 RepID=UPI00040FF1B5|nr:flagellar filament capping protein FliD [Azospirillum halopraeferens]
MTEISTNYTASTGTSALTASNSGTGIDYSALIEAAVAKRLMPADRIDSRITANETKISAYSDLMAKLQAMNGAIDGLRNRTASSGATNNLFDLRAAYLSNTSAMAVTVAPGTETGVHAVEVVQLATRHKVAATAMPSRTDALGLTGPFTLGVEGGTAVTITVDAGMSLTDLRDAINAQKGTAGVTASIVNVTGNEFRLILTANDSGKPIAASDGGGGVLTGLGLIGDDGTFTDELTAAQNAVIRIDGVEVTRSTNTITDALEGITIDLYAATPGETITVEVSEDLASIKAAITGFVDAYNDYRAFVVAQQATTSRGTRSDEAVLFSDSLLRQINSAVYDVLNTSVTTADGALSLAGLGIRFRNDNTLTIDETALNAALTGNIDGVRQLLGLEMTGSSADIRLLRYDKALGRSAFTLDITMNEDGTIASATVDGDDSLFRVSGNRIIGNDGTAVAGLVLVYSGTGGSVDLSFSQGLADRLYTALAGYADERTGTIATVIGQMQTDNASMQTRSDTIRSSAETYRAHLTSYYARLEAAAEQAALLLRQLTYKTGNDD